jgi:LAS superfamily LD-carboxypeptidase LdcB
MNRRCLPVSAAILLSVMSLSHAGASMTARAEALKKQTTRTSGLRSSARVQTRKLTTKTGQVQNGCESCANQAARKTTRRSSQKRTRLAKSVPCHPKNYVNPRIDKNYRTAIRDMNRSGIKPRVTSAWRSSATQARLHRCSLSTRCRRANPGLYRALPPGKSIHEAGFAVDIAGVATGPRGGKRITPRGKRIVAIMKKNGFNWRYGLKDPVHFEADPTKHGYRSTKEAINRTQTTCSVRLAKSRAQKKPPNRVAANRITAKPRLASDSSKSRTRAVKLKA